MGTEMRTSPFVLREGLLFAIAAAASFAFLFHGMFYLDGRSPSLEFRIEPFLFVTGLSYLFLRFVILAIEMRPPHRHLGRVRCPECGQWVDVLTKGRDDRRRSGLRPKEMQDPVASSVTLRHAVHAVQVGTQVRDTERVVEELVVGSQAENATSGDLVAALDDPDFLERARHGPSPPPNNRIKR